MVVGLVCIVWVYIVVSVLYCMRFYVMVKTIYVSEEAHQALKEARWVEKKTISQLASDLILSGIAQRK